MDYKLLTSADPRRDMGKIMEQMNAFAPDSPSRQFLARTSKMRYYPQQCETHGMTPFDSRSGLCLACHHPRLHARVMGEKTFLAECPTCEKETAHSTHVGKCQVCFTEGGQPRTGNLRGARAAARSMGLRIYRDTCETCGPTDFHVTCGKCASCFNAIGIRRPTAATDSREAALAEKRVSYQAKCPTCGPAPHHTYSRRCTVCHEFAVTYRIDGVEFGKRAGYPPPIGARVTFADLGGVTLRVEGVDLTDAAVDIHCSLDDSVTSG